jgi:hypothetical protein
MPLRNLFLDTKGKIKGLPTHWEQYGICLIFHLFWPTIPLLLERLLTGTILPTSITLTAFMYAIGLGIASKNQLQFSFSLVVGLVTAVFFGFAAHATSVKHSDEETIFVTGVDHSLSVIAVLIMVLLFVSLACERYNRHVIDRAPFLEIGRKEEQQ